MDKQRKSIAVQWIGPIVLMVMALGVMLFNFSVKSKQAANDTVTRNMTSAAESSTAKFGERLRRLETVGRPLGELLQRGTMLDTAYSMEIADAAMQYSGAYAVYICDETGNGIDNTGADISIAQADYFEQIAAAEDVEYIFVADDGIKGQNTIIVNIPVSAKSEQGNLLLYYPISNFEAVIKQADIVGWKATTLIDDNGTVLITSCMREHWQQGDNMYDKLGNAEVSRRIKSRVNGRLSGMSAVSMQDGDYSLVYAPLGVNNWALVMTIEQDYIDKQVSSHWRNARNILVQLLLTIAVFGCVIIAINIISKMYDVRKQEQLEVKADTDLLTGLNNKLATERKIKEFIAKHPDSQSMMFILDIDNFKKINDTMGHAFGDEVLRSLGEQIGALFRATDIVGRAGGDEFIIFLKNITDAEVIQKEAKKVEDFFKDFKAGEYTKYSATASIGVAIFPQEGANFESIYKAADSALYKAKKRGKNQLAFYHDPDDVKE